MLFNPNIKIYNKGVVKLINDTLGENKHDNITHVIVDFFNDKWRIRTYSDWSLIYTGILAKETITIINQVINREI